MAILSQGSALDFGGETLILLVFEEANELLLITILDDNFSKVLLLNEDCVLSHDFDFCHF